MKQKKLWSDKKTLKENLKSRLPVLARQWMDGGSHALEPGRTWEEMHDFRLSTKRFRYTLELFVPVYGKGLEKRIGELREIQTLLGDINDCIVTAQLLETIDGMDGERGKLSARAAAKTRKLRQAWKNSFGDEALQRRWIDYFSRFAGRPRRPL